MLSFQQHSFEIQMLLSSSKIIKIAKNEDNNLKGRKFKINNGLSCGFA